MNFEYLKDNLPKASEDIKNQKIRKKIHSYLPVPNDMEIVWAEVNSYGGNPAGFVIADKCIICKAPHNKKKKTNSSYQFIPWEYFEPDSFQIKRNGESFEIRLGDELLTNFYSSALKTFFENIIREYNNNVIVDAALAEELMAGDLEAVAFHAAYGASNSNTGHGIYAEEAGAKLDKLHGEKVAVVGRDNAKNGADKIVNELPVQCKYYKTAGGSVAACFKRDAKTGQMTFRYYQLDGKTPMMVEVPKDQYDKAVQLLEKRILKGEIPGITNPEAAKSIIRKGKLTYKQTVNLAKAGTIESLTYDVATGIISCSAIGGISAIAVFSITYWQTKDKKKAAKASLIAGLEVFGPAFAGRVLAQQLARTAIPNTLIPLSTAITKMLSPQTVQSIINSFRNLAGKKSIYGAAAQKSFAKALRTNALTQIVIFGVTSIPDTYRVIMGKISLAQFTKNLTSGLAAFAGGTAGAVLGAKVGSKAPGGVPQKAIGFAGGAIGGFALGFVVKGVGSLIKEDDRLVYSRMMNSIICTMSIDYVLSEDEVKKLINMLDEDEKLLKKLMQNLIKSDKQYNLIETTMKPYFEKIVKMRDKIGNHEEQEMCKIMDETMIDISKEEK